MYATGVVNAASFSTTGNFTTTASVNTGTLYATGVVNAASHTVGTSVIANTSGITTTGYVNTGTLAVTGSAIIGGTLTVTGNLYTVGNTFVVNATTITTSDLNITLANGAATSSLANGAGLIIATYANIIYSSATSSWQSSVGIIPYSNNLSLGGASNLWNVYANQISGTLITTSQPNITANNSSYLGGTAAASYQLNSTLAANVATLTANNSSYFGGQLPSYYATASSLSSYQTTAGLSANVATLTSNNANYLGGTAAASYQLNSTLAANVSTLTANNATYHNGVSLSTLQGQITGNSATAYSNAVSYVGSQSFVNTSQLSSNLSNYSLLSGASFTGAITATTVTGTGVTGISNSASGVYGLSNTASGVYGASVNAPGVYGISNNNYGVYGYTNASSGYAGVQGVSINNVGVGGSSNTSPGVYGYSNVNFGVQGVSNSGYGMYAISNTGVGLAVQSNTGTVFQAGNATSNFVFVPANGNFGIGTTTPSYKLDVNGVIHSSAGVVVNSGDIVIGTNSRSLYFTDANGYKPFITAQNDGNFVFYNTYANGQTYGIMSYFSGNTAQSPLIINSNTTFNQAISTTGPLNVQGNITVGNSSAFGKIGIQAYSNGTDTFTIGSSDYSHYFTIKPESSANTVQLGYWNGSSFQTMALQGTVTAGSIGIGTSSPGVLLDVAYNANNANYIRITNSNTSSNSVSGFITQAGSVAGEIAASGSGSVLVGATTSNSVLFLSSNGSINATLAANGNFGIGTTAPVSTLYVQQTSGTTAQISGTSSGVRGGMSVDIPVSGAFYVGSYSTSPLALGVNNSGKVYIAANGNFGIQTSSPNNALDISQSSSGLRTPKIVMNDGLKSKITMNFCGTYSSSITYTFGDVVYYDSGSASGLWIYINTTDASGNSPTNGTYWSSVFIVNDSTGGPAGGGGSVPNGPDSPG